MCKEYFCPIYNYVAVVVKLVAHTEHACNYYYYMIIVAAANYCGINVIMEFILCLFVI